MESIYRSVLLSGSIGEILPTKGIKNKQAYYTTITVPRKSDVSDKLIIGFNERVKDQIEQLGTDVLTISGKLYTYRDVEKSTKKWVVTYILVDSVCDEILYDPNNKVELRGYVKSDPIYRTTPKGKLIVEFPLIVGNSIIHIVGWGDIAKDTKDIKQNSNLYVTGRLQSRSYTKGTDVLTAYEVSASSFEVK